MKRSSFRGEVRKLRKSRLLKLRKPTIGR